MQIEYKKLSELNPYKNNPRKNDQAVDVIIKRWEEFTGRKAELIEGDTDGET